MSNAQLGTHDNGYTSTLNYLQNEGLIEKVILLRGYKELAYEIKGLQLPHIDIEGLFMKKKLYTHPSKKTNNAQSAPATPPQTSNDLDKARSKAPTPAKHNNAQTSTPSFNKKARPVPVDQVRHPTNCAVTLSDVYDSLWRDVRMLHRLVLAGEWTDSTRSETASMQLPLPIGVQAGPELSLLPWLFAEPCATHRAARQRTQVAMPVRKQRPVDFLLLPRARSSLTPLL